MTKFFGFNLIMDLDSIIHILVDNEKFPNNILWLSLVGSPNWTSQIWYERKIQILAQLTCLVVCKYYDMCVIIKIMGAPMGLVAILNPIILTYLKGEIDEKI